MNSPFFLLLFLLFSGLPFVFATNQAVFIFFCWGPNSSLVVRHQKETRDDLSPVAPKLFEASFWVRFFLGG